MTKKLIIGLTGGIGSGKSQAADCFKQLGIDIIDADIVARDIIEPGSKILETVVKHFGQSILKTNGSLDRKKLGEFIFEHPDERAWLEQLLHPEIREQMKKLARASSSPYCVMVIPLLIETLPNPLIDRILVIDCSESLQKQRVMARDSSNEAAVEAIFNAQVSRQERLDKADDVIDNSGNINQLLAQVERLHQHYLTLCQR